jgi:16S rRNA processing protein RimM
MALRNDVILRSPQSGRLEGRIAPIQADAGPESPLDAPAKRVCVGVVAGAHGVQGAVRIKSFTADPKDVARYGPVEDEKGERRFRLRLAGSAKGVVIARLNGILDRNQAEALRGLRLYLPRAALPPTADEEYYHADLIGLDVALGDGTPLGQVRAVHDFGAGDTLEIERPAGPPAMVPFTRAIVPVVDLAAGRLVVDPPPGLIDEPAPRRNRGPHPNPPPPAGEGVEEAPMRLKPSAPAEEEMAEAAAHDNPPPQSPGLARGGEGMGGGKRPRTRKGARRRNMVSEPEPAS